MKIDDDSGFFFDLCDKPFQSLTKSKWNELSVNGNLGNGQIKKDSNAFVLSKSGQGNQAAQEWGTAVKYSFGEPTVKADK